MTAPQCHGAIVNAHDDESIQMRDLSGPRVHDRIHCPVTPGDSKGTPAATMSPPTHLSGTDEQAILDRQVATPDAQPNVAILFAQARPIDYFVFIGSTLGVIIGGACLPFMAVIFGRFAGVMQDYHDDRISADQLSHRVAQVALYLAYLGLVEFVTVCAATCGFVYVGQRITDRLRHQLLQACLQQNIAFYDTLGAGSVTNWITDDTHAIQQAISEKLALVLAALATLVSAFVIGFIVYWRLTLILSSIAVCIILVMGLGSRVIMKHAVPFGEALGDASAFAHDVFSSILSAKASGTQEKLATRYDTHLARAEVSGTRMQVALGFMYGSMFLVMYLGYALAFWQGAHRLTIGEAPLSAMITVLLAINSGSLAVGHVSSNFQLISKGLATTANVARVILRKSPLDPSSSEGKKLDDVQGSLELRHVRMLYPSRPTVVVLDDFSLSIEAGKHTAIVGASGSGKSTIVGLLERFYEPVSGQILLDGHDISALNLKWLRQQISLVSQEPILFNATIFNNIAYGCVATEFEQLSPKEQKYKVIAAAERAKVHEFICSLPQGYDTMIGDRGLALSGGQRQRIAIARAVISQPKILLLDEATAALDSKTEAEVQAALDAVSHGRTTITIAHRLSTIRTADKIVVMRAGRIVEQGTHEQLVQLQGYYSTLVAAHGFEKSQPPDCADVDDTQISERSTLKSIDSDADRKTVYATSTRTDPEKSATSAPVKNDDDSSIPRTYPLWTLIKMTARYNVREWPWMILGLCCSVVCGAACPVSAVFFANILTTLTAYGKGGGATETVDKASFWSLMYVALAVSQLAAAAIEGYAFALCSERLMRRARRTTFAAVLRQDMAFFEAKPAGSLTSLLASEPTNLAALSGPTLGTLLNAFTTVIGSLALSIVIGWKLALVSATTIPIMLLCGYLRFGILVNMQARTKASYTASAAHACEAVSAIRVIASLAREDDVLRRYERHLKQFEAQNMLSVITGSALYATSGSLIFLCMALCFWYGGRLIAADEYSVLQFYICFAAIIFGSQSAGVVLSFVPDLGKAYRAACQLKQLFDRVPEIESNAHAGQEIATVEGSIQFQDVHFNYPTRPNMPVLRGLTFSVQPKQFVALVGSSGSGKSTAIALLERFYDPDRGKILVDGKDVCGLDVIHYRRHLALVSQESTLYMGTILDNIKLGCYHDPNDDEVISVCKEANIHDFITSLPNAYSTNVGSRGTLLSGGQKQRLSIARALIRKSNILLLDEATSALDSSSERVVQAAIDVAARGKTTLVVAHRLSTIQRADVICVLHQGRLVEQGTHEHLMAKGGRYAELVALQNLERQGHI